MGTRTLGNDKAAGTPSPDPAATSADILRLSSRLATPLRVLASARVRRNLSFDDALILLAVGHLNFGVANRMLTLRPVNYCEVAQLLRMPRETVRRKMKRLEELELIAFHSKGAIVAQVAEWQALAQPLAGASA